MPESESPQTPPSIKNDIRIPEATSLYDALEKILWFWPNVYIQAYREGSNPQESFDLERAVRLTGQHQGLVVLRSRVELGKILSRALGEDETLNTEDAFDEFVNMFCGHIMNKIRSSEKVIFRHFLPFQLLMGDRINRPPEAEMTVAIQEIPLNVRLWIESDTSSGDE